MFFYSYWWVMLPAILFTMYASGKVKSHYHTYAKVRSARGLTGLQVAENILRANHINDVTIKMGRGQMTDHYNPRTKTVVLSPHVYNTDSVAAASIAAHECGHVLQHAQGYAPLKVRAALVGPVNFASKITPILILIGFISFTRNPLVLDLAIAAYAVVFLFHLVTLPVELNASSRAIHAMAEGQLVYDDDLPGTKKVLSAAALTYVAAMLASLMQIVRLIMIRDSRD